MLRLNSNQAVVDKKLMVEASYDPIDDLSGIIEFKEAEAKKLIESEEWY